MDAPLFRATIQPGKRSYQEKKHGFTLVEILVVTGILTFLAALLFGAFSHLRENGRRSACQDNLKNLGIAMQQYVHDHDGRLPCGFVWEVDPSGIMVADFTWREDIEPYVKNPGLFSCPSYVAQNTKWTAPETTNYLYNSGRLSVASAALPAPALGKSETEFSGRTDVWVLTDWDKNGSPNLSTVPSDVTSCGQPFTGDTRHSGGANYTFVDSHVKWMTPFQMAELECVLSKESP